MKRATIVLDIGKTHSKLTLWDALGRPIARRSRVNGAVEGVAYRELDVAAVESWLAEGLADYAHQADVGAIVPVAHGAAAALVSGGALYAPPMDYEDEALPEIRAAYEAQRDPFSATGSPSLPCGLNLGLQLYRLEALADGAWPADLQILPWPQYWAWRLSGVAACEVTSLGSHTDLWRPIEGGFSALAQRRGWAARMPLLRHAREALGPLSPEWQARTGLPADCQVHCGLHDSNAALVAALGHPELAGRDVTILSTGTWFVAMRSPAPGARLDTAALRPDRDCLVNIDVDEQPIPSARFMGGREAERLCEQSLGIAFSEDVALVAEASSLIASRVMALPTATPGVGPFPDGPGGWTTSPPPGRTRRAAVSLYLALMADASLDLVGSRERLLVEGRFAEDLLFVRALAAMRPNQQVYTSHAQDDVCYGALRLLNGSLAPPSPLEEVEPLALDLDGYRRDWRARIAADEREAAR